MEIFLGENIKILDINKYPENDVKFLISKLKIDNPLFFKRTDLGLANWGISSSLIYYKNYDNILEIPMGMLATIKERFKTYNVTYVDKRVTNSDTNYFNNITFTGALRDYQEEIVDTCLKEELGIVEAMTGSGKSISMVKLILNRKQNTLLLVNTIELANQLIETFIKFTTLRKDDIGFIGNGNFTVLPITIALHQSMARLDDKAFKTLNENFGQILADEVHICAAETYYNTLNKLSAKYKFGFSATPKRDDGLTDVLHFASGDIIYKLDVNRLDKVLIKPQLLKIDTSYTFPIFTSDEYQALLTDLSEDVDRNKLIVDTASTYVNKNMCFLCVRISQVEALKKLMPDAEILTSKMKKKERSLAMSNLISGKSNKIISTYALFSTGIDIPHLDIAFLCAPLQSEVKLRQTAGRIMRKSGNKSEAIIIDFVDNKVSILKHQYYKRKRVLENLW